MKTKIPHQSKRYTHENSIFYIYFSTKLMCYMCVCGRNMLFEKTAQPLNTRFISKRAFYIHTSKNKKKNKSNNN